MSPIVTTFLTSMLSTIGVPWLEKKYGLHLPPEQQTMITAACVGIATASAHWFHTRVFTSRRGRHR